MTGARTLAAIAGLVLVPFGNLSEQLKSHNPWNGFDAKGPNLLIVRAQTLTQGSCANWLRALQAKPLGLMPWSSNSSSSSSSSSSGTFKAWEPWSEDDLKSIRKCDDQPCEIKLGDKEVAQMKAASDDARLSKYQSLIQERVKAYQTKQERKGYEFPGNPVEPWSEFEKAGFKTELKLPSEPALFIRKLEFAPGQARALHQIVDRRVAVSSQEGVSWLRDVYNDHYFDSWGEWTQVSCSEGGEIRVVQALFLEFDLLKKHDFFSGLMHGKMRGAVESQGTAYLNRAFQQLRELALQPAAPNQSK